MYTELEHRLADRWLVLTNNLCIGSSELVLKDLLARYKEPQRHYHDQEHPEACFLELDEFRHLMHDPDAVDLGLWFHDAFYNPAKKRAGDPSDEELSAVLAEKTMTRRMGLNCHYARLVGTYVRDTKHNSYIVHGEAMWVLDADLSILGRPTEEFDWYEEKIRLEYAFVPIELFRAKRAEILERFLDTSQYPTVFRTYEFQKKYEQQARANLARSIERLRA